MAKRNSLDLAAAWVFVLNEKNPTLVEGSTWQVQPVRINTSQDWHTIYGECEMEVVAREITKWCQQKNGWFLFRRQDLKLSEVRFATSEEHDGLEDLRRGQFIGPVGSGLYIITDEFIRRAHAKFPNLQPTLS